MKNKNTKLQTTYEIASILLTAVLAVGVIFTFFFKMSTVSGESMQNTLQHGDNLLITSITPEINPGDVVVVSQPNGYEKVLIKRVIAVGGQSVSFDSKTGKTMINGQIIDEPYTKEKAKYTYAMTKTYFVPEGKIFVMGDNRNNSKDARYWENTYVEADKILGEAVFRYWPFDSIGMLK